MVDDELIELACAEVEDFVRGSFLEDAPIISVSSRTGAGVDQLKEALMDLAARVEPKTASAVPRLPVDRAFSIRGFGTVVTGTLIAGELAEGDELEVLPAGFRTRARNIQVHGRDAERALAGQRTAVNLQGVNVEQVERGSLLAPAGRLRATSMIDARLDLLPSAPRPLSQRARVRLHHGTAEVMARVVILTGSGFGVQGSGFGVQGSEFGVQGSEFRVWGSGFGVQGSVFGVQGSEFGVPGSGPGFGAKSSELNTPNSDPQTQNPKLRTQAQNLKL